jgi:multidrug efflux system membrane fusion protein
MNQPHDPSRPHGTEYTRGEPSPDASHESSGKGRWILLAVLLAVAGGVALFVRSRKSDGAGPQTVGNPADRVVPVMVAAVEQKDVPIYVEGLGNVTPLATVTVKTQVDGRLDQVLFKEGQQVKRGDVLAQIDPRPFTILLHTAEAALARDTATMKNAQLNLERYKTLRQQALIPQQQLDDQQATADQAAASVKSDMAQAENARLQLEYARIVSPIDGVTGVRLVDQGNLVHPSDPGGIVVITQLDPIAVLFTLPEDDLPRVAKEYAKGPLDVEAYSRDGTHKLGQGQLTVVDNQINTATATIRLKATFPNPDRALWPNEFIKARMHLRTIPGALAVPATVVQRGPQGVFAYVVGPDKTVSVRPIEVESTEGDLAIIAKGLAAGEEVVADGQNQLRPGAKVAPRPAGTNPSASANANAGPNGLPDPPGASSGQPRRGGKHGNSESPPP